MKKVIFYAILILVTLLAVESVIAISIKNKDIELSNYTEINSFFENYKEKTLYGSDVVSIINKVIDLNENAFYKNPIKLEVIFIMEDQSKNIIEKTSNIEEIQKAGMDGFIAGFSSTRFKCSNIEYNKSNIITKVTIRQMDL